MKKLLIIAALLLATITAGAQNRWFVGGTGAMGYDGAFNFSFEPIAGYEFTDRWAVGTGVGVLVAAVGGYSTVMGVAEPFVRFCAWHNDLVFLDLKATGGVAFTDELELCQVGIQPSLRFRFNEHWEMAADIGFFGAQYTPDSGWKPKIGFSATSAGLWFAYLF